MSEEQAAAPVVEKTAEEKQAAEKAAAEEGQERLRAFTVGVGQLCEETKIPYDELAKQAGVEPGALAPALVNSMAEAAEKAEKAEKPASSAAQK